MKKLRDGATRPTTAVVLRTVASLVLGLASVFAAESATAQAVNPFRVTDFGGWVELGFFTNLEDRGRTNSADSASDRIEFCQIVHADAKGYVYHPRFFTFASGAEFEVVEGVLNGGDSRFLGGGHLRLNFLQNHPNGLAIFGSAFRNEFDRAFSETYDVTTLLVGTTFYQRWGWVPFSLTYQHREEMGGVDDDLDNSWDEVRFNGRYALSEESDGRIDYDLAFEDRLQNRSRIKTRRQNLVVNNRSYFGGEQERRLFTNFLFNEQVDGLEQYSIASSTDFTWQHTEDLSTRYRLNVNWSDVEVQTVTTVNPSFFINHNLYESLATQLEFFGRFEDASYGTRNEFGASLNERYRKWTGDWGLLTLGFTPRVSMAYDRPDQDTAIVIDESHMLFLGTQEPLFRNDVIESTIVVTNLDGTIVYDEGVLGDYIVIQQGGGFETSLELTPVSDIVDGEAVLVDYEYELGGRKDVLFTNVNVFANYRLFNQLQLYGRYEKVNQHLVSGDERNLRLNDIDRYVLGLKLDGRFYSVDAEYEDYDADLGSFSGYSGSASLFTYGLDAWSASVTAAYAFRDHSDSDEDVTRIRVRGAASARLFRRGLLEVDIGYLRERWNGDFTGSGNDLDSLLVEADYSWTYGKLEVRLESRMAQILREAEDKRVYRVRLRARRRF